MSAAVVYLLAWMAAGVQHPERQAEVAVVLKGLRGVGKGVFAQGYGSLFGRHFLHIAQGAQVTKNGVHRLRHSFCSHLAMRELERSRN